MDLKAAILLNADGPPVKILYKLIPWKGQEMSEIIDENESKTSKWQRHQKPSMLSLQCDGHGGPDPSSSGPRSHRAEACAWPGDAQ